MSAISSLFSFHKEKTNLKAAKFENVFAIFGEIQWMKNFIMISMENYLGAIADNSATEMNETHKESCNQMDREEELKMGYKNFTTAIYCTVRDVEAIADHPEFDQEFDLIEKHMMIDKVYLETYRSGNLISHDKIQKVKDYFLQKGIKTSAGITTDISNQEGFLTFCYTKQEHREFLRQVVAFTAELFDEIILDDFFFTNCKCESCIQAKGERNWSDFRMELLQRVATEIVIKTAKGVNPKVNLIIKYPNWYDEYQNTGYNLQEEPLVFDGIYTGTETRDPQYTQQDLQRYQSYFLMRYLENVKPGANGGGWFDTFDCMYNMSSYAEQGYLTLFSKAKEVTLFCLGLLLRKNPIFVPLAGFVFERVDKILGELGNPMGISCYKPYHSSGENYLFGYLGMLGLSLEPEPRLAEKEWVLLTESAKEDPLIVERLKERLCAGKKVVMTSGLLKALKKRGFDDIAEITVTDRKVMVAQYGYPMHDCSFENYVSAARPILIPQIEFATNDCVPLIVAFAESKNYPILLKTRYGGGILYVLTIPENYGDLYAIPAPILDRIRGIIMAEMPVRLEGPGHIALFLYDNCTFIVESFLPYHSDCRIVIHGRRVELKEIGVQPIMKEFHGWEQEESNHFKLKMAPASYRVFRYRIMD